MRAIVISDIHGNIDVLRALEKRWGERLEQFDRVVCLGDLVDYGPNPREVIEWVRSRATDIVCGNHEYAMATGEPCRSAPAYLEASIGTRERLRPTLASEHIEGPPEALDTHREVPLITVPSVPPPGKPPAWTRLSTSLLRNWISNRLQELWAPAVDRAVAAYLDVLRRWATDRLAHLREEFESASRPLLDPAHTRRAAAARQGRRPTGRVRPAVAATRERSQQQS